jgi:cell wall-associated NlpC family hydrolase
MTLRRAQGERMALARAAESFVGAAFRMHGRDPVAGLDCLGLALLAMAEIGRPVRLPIRYTLRNLDLERFERLPADAGLEEIDAPLEPGDIVLLETGPAQFHMAVVANGGGIVHAHAGLRRVVRTPFPLPWPLVRQWRLDPL